MIVFQLQVQLIDLLVTVLIFSVFLMFTIVVDVYLSFSVLAKMHFTTFIYNSKLSLNFGCILLSWQEFMYILKKKTVFPHFNFSQLKKFYHKYNVSSKNEYIHWKILYSFNYFIFKSHQASNGNYKFKKFICAFGKAYIILCRIYIYQK